MLTCVDGVKALVVLHGNQHARFPAHKEGRSSWEVRRQVRDAPYIQIMRSLHQVLESRDTNSQRKPPCLA